MLKIVSLLMKCDTKKIARRRANFFAGNPPLPPQSQNRSYGPASSTSSITPHLTILSSDSMYAARSSLH